MLFHIKHTTRFTYSGPVYCEPLTVRLRPRCDGAQRLVKFRASVDPAPDGATEMLEPDGHTSLRYWFNRLTSAMAITTTSIVETLRPNPFDYLLDADALQLPLPYPEELRMTLAPYQRPASSAGPVFDLADDLLRRSQYGTLDFLRRVNLWLFETIAQEDRPVGDPRPAETTLDMRVGSCRDVAVLFIELSRSVGLAARFVSGYDAGAPGQVEHHLHAWAEVYLPGGGWRGYDPSRGLAVGDRHVAVAAARQFAGAAPTSGKYRGTAVTSKLEAQVVVRMQEGTSNAALIESDEEACEAAA